MNGYTKGARNELFALRPAPIQVMQSLQMLLVKHTGLLSGKITFYFLQTFFLQVVGEFYPDYFTKE